MEATGRERLKAATTWWKQQAERPKAATTWWKQQAEQDLKQQRPDGSNRQSKTQSSNDLIEATGWERLKAAATWWKQQTKQASTTWWKQQAEQDSKQQRPDGSNRQSKT